jgi:hypothetical protein
MAVATLEKPKKVLIYKGVIGDREGNEDDDLSEIMEFIRKHLDAAEQSGRTLEIHIFSS